MTKFPKVTHIIFDVDGLLLDTQKTYTNNIQRFLDEYGKECTWEMKLKWIGRSRREATQLIIDDYKLPLTLSEAIAKFDVIYEETYPHVTLLPGVERLVRHFHRHNVPMALTTGNDQFTLDLKTRNHGDLFSCFPNIVTIDDPKVLRGKPAPDGFLLTASRFIDSPSPNKVLVFEDSIHGVSAASSAGMQCVWVPGAGIDPSGDAGATVVLASLTEFEPALFGLPPFNS